MRYLCLLLSLLVVLPTLGASPIPVPKSLAIGGLGKNGIELVGRAASWQVVLSGVTSDGKLFDYSRTATYSLSPEGIAKIDATGHILPISEGKAKLTATQGGVSVSVEVTVSRQVKDVPVHFTNQVVPIFTKFGCNAGGCHGKADGQNGFKLSLLGFEPQEDHEYIVKEAKGRRVFFAAPENSLLVKKAIGAVPHGGGKKLDKSSPFYQVLVRWIEQGAPFDKSSEGAVTKIEVFPKDRVLEKEAGQQLLVIAHHADGGKIDVTRMAHFESNSADISEVSTTGYVTTKKVPGTSAVMVRYQSFVDVFRGTVPMGAPVENLPKSDHPFDKLVFNRLKELGLPPSELADDSTFLRRITIDIAGRLPTKTETEEFLKDTSADKREKLIDRLLASPEYGDYFAMKWGAILRNRRKNPNDDIKPTAAFREWIKKAITENKPYDQFVRDLLTVTGEEIKDPPVVWYRELKDQTTAMEDVAQLFLGQRLGCAKCHHHPMEKWSQHDYWSFAAFFSKWEVKEAKPAKKNKDNTMTPAEPTTLVLKNGKVETKNPRTNKVVMPAGLGEVPMSGVIDGDLRTHLADWMTNPKNPYFAKSLVNRYWKHFMGRGLVDPEDDLRITNPATNPELLDALAKSFIESKYDLKKLVRDIATTKTYQLSALPNKYNADDTQNYSRFLPKRLPAEVLLDAVDDVTLSKSKFGKGVQGTPRAVQLPDNVVDSYFLSVFGRPDSSSACECERAGGASLAQALHMYNSTEIQTKVAGPRIVEMAKSKLTPAQRIEEIYLIALSRKPTTEETETLVKYLEKKGGNQAAYEDVLWVILNTKEFMFNH